MTLPARRKPILVVIDARELTYKRYIGREPGVKVRAEEPMLPNEIETLRTHPELILPSDPPEYA